MIPDLDISLMGSILKMGLALLISLPMGWVRERNARSADLRTYPLVAVGACALLLIGQRSMTEDLRDQADIYYGLLTGVGFIGSGALLKSTDELHGMATAISLWVTAALGAAVAYGLPVVAVALSVMGSLTLLWNKPS